MRLHRLRITAFGPFSGTEEIDFDALSDAGLFLVQGRTGAGKTSILDAVCFALYGQVPGARNAAKGLRSDHAAPGTGPSVVLETTIRGRRLRITGRPRGSGRSCAAPGPPPSTPRSSWRSSRTARGSGSPPGSTRRATSSPGCSG